MQRGKKNNHKSTPKAKATQQTKYLCYFILDIMVLDFCKVRLTTTFIGYRMRKNTQRAYQLAVGVNGVEELNVGLPLKHEVPDVLVLYFGEGRFSCVKLKNETKIVLKWF
jgi:hypothetical protein